MDTYICFNDESGSLNDNKSVFYVRASVIVNSLDLKNIENDIKNIRANKNLSNLDCEIKWQDIWQLRKYFKKNESPRDKRLSNIYNYLKNIKQDYHLLIDYCEEVLNLIDKHHLKIILTFTVMNEYSSYKKESLYKFHIQDHLQRIQMQYPKSIVVLVYDNIDEQTKKIFKQIHKELVNSGDFVKYESIFSSLLFDDSYDNGLIQIADYVCGAFANVLKAVNSNNTNNYQKSVDFFIKYIIPQLAKDNDNEVWGAGIKETPKNDEIRDKYSKKIKNLELDWQVIELFGGSLMR